MPGAGFEPVINGDVSRKNPFFRFVPQNGAELVSSTRYGTNAYQERSVNFQDGPQQPLQFGVLSQHTQDYYCSYRCEVSHLHHLSCVLRYSMHVPLYKCSLIVTNMAVINVKIPDQLDKKFRIAIIQRHGAKKGALSQAVKEAIELWLKS